MYNSTLSFTQYLLKLGMKSKEQISGKLPRSNPYCSQGFCLVSNKIYLTLTRYDTSYGQRDCF